MKVDFGDECLKELNLDESELTDLTNQQISNFAPSYNGKCLVACSLKKVGFIVEERISTDYIQNSLPSNVSVEYDGCQAITENDDCERIFKMAMCVIKQLPEFMVDQI